MVAEHCVVTHACAGRVVDGERQRALQRAVERTRLLDPHHPPLVRQRAVGDRPPLSERAEQVLARDDDVVEEDFVEVGAFAVVHLGDRPHRDARRIHVDDHAADPHVLRRVGIGADEEDASLGVLRSGRPHLLPVDDEHVVAQLGAG